MMWSTTQHDQGRQDSELMVMNHDHPEMDKSHAEQNTSAFQNPSHPESSRLTPMELQGQKPGSALLLSSTIRPLLTAAGSEESNNYYIDDPWRSSPTRGNLLSNKRTTSISSQNSFLLTDEIAMKPEMNFGVGGVSSSLLTSSISNDYNDVGRLVGVGRMMRQQQGVISSMSSEAVRSSMMTIKSHPGEASSAEEKEVPYHALHFPWRLHQMLEAAESHGFSHIVSWLPELQDHDHRNCDSTSSSNEMGQEQSSLSRKKRSIVGTPFRVHEPGIFEKVIMPRFFRQTKFKSFRRQINLWSFERIRSGPNKGGYQCDYFVRSNPSLCARMRRSKAKRPQEEQDDDFANNSAASSSVQKEHFQQQQQEANANSQKKGPGVSSLIRRSQVPNLTATTTTGDTTLASLPHNTLMMAGEEPGRRTTTTNMDQYPFTGNSLSSSSLSWFESQQVSLLNYAYAVLRASQSDPPISNIDSPLQSPPSILNDDIEQELISTFCPAFHMLLENDHSDNE